MIGVIPESLPSSMIGVGGGIIPASRFLRRRAAAEDLGADVDAFWSAAPRLYDFSQSQSQQQQQPQALPPPLTAALPRSPSPPPPSPPPSPTSPAQEEEEEEEEEARDQCLLFLRRSPSPPPSTPAAPHSPSAAARGSPSPPGPCLLTLLRGSLVWGGRRSATYHRHRPGGGGGGSSLPEPVVAVLERPAAGEGGKARGAKKMKRLEEVEKETAAGKSGRRRKRVAVKTEDNRRVTRSSLRRRRGGSRRAKKKVKTEVKEEEEEAASCKGDKRARKVLPVKKEENEDEDWSGDKKRKRPEAAAEASSRVKREAVGTGEVRVYHRRRRHAAKQAETVPKHEEETKPTTKLSAPTPSSPRGGKVDRWSARRYAAGEAALLDILRARGATAGAPAPRAELRAEARKCIGDTGLLDHLLLHTADKVPAGSAERIRRRYNVDGALEYFLEPAGLKALRKEAGVEDPFWVPPPGWRLGDPTSLDAVTLAVKKQVEELAAELAVVKRQMKKLSSNLVHVGKEAYISWKGYDCMLKANENLGKELLSMEEKYDSATQTNGKLKEELLLLKDNYESLAEKNARLEEQMIDISSCFQMLKNDLPLLEPEGGEQHVLMLEPADHCVKEPYEAEIDKQEAGDGNVLGNVAVGASKATAGKGSISEKRTSRKCSMRICKPQRTFAWPNTSAGMATGEACSPKALPEPLTLGGDLIVTNFDTVIYNPAPSSLEEYLAIDGLPTPTSSSSTTAASTRHPLQQLSTTAAGDDGLQTVQPCSGRLDSQLPRKALSSSSSAPCLLEFGKKALVLGGSNVGTELATATPSY